MPGWLLFLCKIAWQAGFPPSFLAPFPWFLYCSSTCGPPAPQAIQWPMATSPQLGLHIWFLLMHVPAVQSLPLCTKQCPSKANGHSDDVTRISFPTYPCLSLLALITLFIVGSSLYTLCFLISCLCLECPFYLDWCWHTFAINGQMVNIWGFAGHTVSVATTQLS